MRLLGNIVWILLGGIWIALGWLILGLFLCVTIIGIPLGLQCFKASSLTLTPFGKRVLLDYGRHPIANLLWAIFCGWIIALFYLLAGLICCITIIGIPFGLQAFKMMKLAFFPFGASIQ